MTLGSVSRRTVRQAAAATASSPGRADRRALADSLGGDVVRRSSADYDDVKQLFDPRFDRAQPRSHDGSTRVRVGGTCDAGDQDVQAAALQRSIGVDATSVSTFEESFMDGVRFFGGGSTSARTAFAAGSDVIATMSADLSKRLVHVIARRAADGGSGVVLLDPLTGAVADKTVGATAFPWRHHLADLQWVRGPAIRCQPNAGPLLRKAGSAAPTERSHPSPSVRT